MQRRYDEIITIQRKTDTQSNSGEPVSAWANIVQRRPAGMTPLKGDEQFAGPQENAGEEVEFRVRYSSNLADLTPLDRIIHPAFLTGEAAEDAPDRFAYDILAVEEVGRFADLKIKTRRRPDILETFS